MTPVAPPPNASSVPTFASARRSGAMTSMPLAVQAAISPSLLSVSAAGAAATTAVARAAGRATRCGSGCGA
eukprot:3457075-Prymnesium_polylepis.2